MRRLSLVLGVFVATLAVSAAFVGASAQPAQATVTPPYQNPAYADELWDLIRMRGAFAADGASVADYYGLVTKTGGTTVVEELTAARIGAAALPEVAGASGLALAGPIIAGVGIAALGGYVLWRVFHEDGSHENLKISARSDLLDVPASLLVSNLRWEYGGGFWRYRGSPLQPHGTSVQNLAAPNEAESSASATEFGSGGIVCPDGTIGGATCPAINRALALAVANELYTRYQTDFATVGTFHHANYQCTGAIASYSYCYVRTATEEQYRAKVAAVPIDDSLYNSLAGGASAKVQTVKADPSKTTALNTVRTNLDTSSTSTKDWVNHELDPDHYPDPFASAAAPICYGLTVTACQSAWTTWGFTGTVTTSAGTTYDGAIGSGTVQTTTPKGGVDYASSPATLHIVTNPVDPATTTWTIPTETALANCRNHTYNDCVQYLRTAGFLGTITEGDTEYDQPINDDLTAFQHFVTPGRVTRLDPGSGTILQSGTIELPKQQEDLLAVPQWYYPQTALELANIIRAAGFTGTITILKNDASPDADPYGPYTSDPPCTAEAMYSSAFHSWSHLITEALYSWSWYESAQLSRGWLKDNANFTIYANAPTSGDNAVASTDDCGASEVPGETAGSHECPCPIPAVDFTPVKELDGGNKFPFGVFMWFRGVLDNFVVTPDAPEFKFTCPDNVPGITCDAVYDVDLNVFDSYMAVIRDLLAVAVWVGVIWGLATHLLGFRFGGNPGEAVDDGSVI